MSWSGGGDNYYNNQKKDPIPSFLVQPQQMRGQMQNQNMNEQQYGQYGEPNNQEQQPYPQQYQQQPYAPQQRYAPQQPQAPQYPPQQMQQPFQQQRPPVMPHMVRPEDTNQDKRKLVQLSLSRGSVAFLMMFFMVLGFMFFGAGYLMGKNGGFSLPSMSASKESVQQKRANQTQPRNVAPQQQYAPQQNDDEYYASDIDEVN